MKTILRFILVAAVAFGAAGLSGAQAPEDDYPRFSQAELDSMLAPIALYPDSLLSQMLMAATFPRDVAEAAAWSRANAHVRGQDAVRAVAQEPWDPSVKSLVAFPQVLHMMDEHLEWTERLGDAFMANPTGVSDTIQVLRARADSAGTLRSGEEVVVRRDYGNYVIEPADPEVFYVPYYDPRVAYGTWWWPNYEPVWWEPWPGYAWSSGYLGFAWGYGVTVGSGFWYSSFDWPRRYIRFGSHRPYYWRGHSRWHGHRWYSDRDHRRNSRNWHWSGYRGDRDGRYGGSDRGREWRRDGRDGRDGRGGWSGRDGRDGRDGRGGRSTGGGERSVERAPTPGVIGVERAPSQRYVAPRAAPGALSPGAVAAPSTGLERRAGPAPAPRTFQPAPVQQGQPAATQPLRGFERAQERRHVAPQAQPLQRAPSMPSAPAPSPVAREPRPAPSPVAREPRSAPSAPREESRPAPAAAESRQQERSGGGGNPLGRGGGRAAHQ